MHCLSGEYRHSIDPKGRLFMPAKLRAQLGEGFYVCKWMGGYLAVHSEDDFKLLASKIDALPVAQSNRLRQILFPSANECDVDAQGRILLPQSLRDYAGIKKDAVIAGMGNHAAIWAGERYDALPPVTDELLTGAFTENPL
jgi:MraZ protein